MRRLPILLAAFLIAAPGLAQDPGGQFQVNTVAFSPSGPPGVAMDGAGNFVVTWGGDGPAGKGVYGRLFSPKGSPRGDQFLIATKQGEDQDQPAVDFDETGFVVVWRDFIQSQLRLFVRRYTAEGAPRGPAFPLGTGCCADVALGPGGRFLIAGLDFPSSTTVHLFALPFDGNGNPTAGRVVLSNSINSGVSVASLGEEGYVAVWREGERMLGRRLGLDGAPLGDNFAIEGPLGDPEVAARPGGFAVSWGSVQGVFLRLFTLSRGSAVTASGLLQVAGGSVSSGLTGLAADAEGKLLVTWERVDPARGGPDMYGRRFESSGEPASGPFKIATYPLGSQQTPIAAAGPANHFVVAWQAYFFPPVPPPPGSVGSGIFARRIAWARAGSDPCFFRAGRFLCDVAHDGGGEELTLRFGGAEGDRPLLGDLDGDGRDEPYVYRAGRFLCDEVQITYGAPGDVPLLGDLDGEGRDDACVRRGNRFLCDTKHDGGTAEMVIAFGGVSGVSDVPLLGDLDGDGDDDPCLFQGGTFRCDLAHDGRNAEAVIAFGAPGDLPLLGDLDGDGRDDPCVFRSGSLLCDTRHDGGAAEVTLSFTLTGVPVLGNPDGL